MAQEKDFQSLGGKARAEKLTPEQRSEIATIAAESRWQRKADSEGMTRLPKATHLGELKMLGSSIPCAVLENGKRVLTQRGMFVALGRNKNPSTGHIASIDSRPGFLAAANLNEFIPEDLRRSWEPVPFRLPKGSGGFKGNIAFGYDATILPKICNVFVDAKIAGKTTKQQEHIVTACRNLLKGLAGVAIVALVDEATGYQYDRAKDELSRILEAYITKELLPWTRRFPDEFFKQAFRLHGWEYREGSVKSPRYLGKLINRTVYEPMPPGVLDELKLVNPKTESGYRKYHHHRFLTPDTGHPHLDRQIVAVTTLMRVADNKEKFWDLFGKAFPKKNQQDKFSFGDSEPLELNG
jgi:hypothetical protein